MQQLGPKSFCVLQSFVKVCGVELLCFCVGKQNNNILQGKWKMGVTQVWLWRFQLEHYVSEASIPCKIWKTNSVTTTNGDKHEWVVHGSQLSCVVLTGVSFQVPPNPDSQFEPYQTSELLAVVLERWGKQRW